MEKGRVISKRSNFEEIRTFGFTLRITTYFTYLMIFKIYEYLRHLTQ